MGHARPGFAHVRASQWAAFERHDDNTGVELLKRPFVLLQLQQMPAARQSTQVPMEDQQQPMPAVVPQLVKTARHVRKRE